MTFQCSKDNCNAITIILASHHYDVVSMDLFSPTEVHGKKAKLLFGTDDKIWLCFASMKPETRFNLHEVASTAFSKLSLSVMTTYDIYVYTL